MSRRISLVRSLPVVVALGLVACADPVTPRPRAPLAALTPTPRGPAGPPQPVDSSPPGLVPVHPVAVTIGGVPANGQITVGVSVSLTVSARDSSGATMSGLTPTWSVSDTTIATIGAASGALTASRAGAFKVGAFVNDTTAWIDVVAVGGTTPPPPPPPPSPSSFALTVQRFDGGTGAVTVSSGIPLIPGALRPGQEDLVRVTIGGVEQAAYVTGLTSLHPDGSLRAVLVQFQLPSLAATGATGRLDIGTTRPATMTIAAPLATPGAVVAGTPKGLPQAAALPSDPNYLVATDLVGATTTQAATAALGGVFVRYDSDFARFADQLWAVEGVDYLLADYYDRVLIYYAMWARTGNVTYWARAGQIAYDYRVRYLEANNYGSSPHWSQLEGLEKHYLMTGDDMSRTAVAKTAKVLVGFIPSNYMTGATGESRIAARVLHAQLLAWRLSTATSGAGGQTAAYWASQVDAAFAKIAAWQQADGSFPATAICGGQLNYMVGMQNDALIKLDDYYAPSLNAAARATLSTRIRTIVQKASDYMWRTQWLPTKGSFNYASVDCVANGVGGPTPAPDLNNLIVTGYGWLYKATGNVAYRDAGDQIFAGGVTQAYLTGTKQFNENYTSSFRYPAYR